MPPEIVDLTHRIAVLWRQFQWLPEWAVVALVVVVFIGAGWLVHRIVFSILRRLVKSRDLFWRGVAFLRDECPEALPKDRLNVPFPVGQEGRALRPPASPPASGPR